MINFIKYILLYFKKDIVIIIEWNIKKPAKQNQKMSGYEIEKLQHLYDLMFSVRKKELQYYIIWK